MLGASQEVVPVVVTRRGARQHAAEAVVADGRGRLDLAETRSLLASESLVELGNRLYKRNCLIWDLYGPREVVGEVRVGTTRPKSRVDVDASYANHLFLTEIKFGHVLTECSHVPLSSTVRGHNPRPDDVVVL